MGSLYIAGELIPAGRAVVISILDGKAYEAAVNLEGEYIGSAVEQLREGFRIHECKGEVREDDA